MFKINNNADLRNAYLLISIMRKNGYDEDCAVIHEQKKEIRKYYREYDNGIRLVKDYGIDGRIQLHELPEDIDSYEEAQWYFDTEEKMIYRPTYYDCTGQAFTGWYKLFKRNGKWYAYHRICLDV